MNNQNYRGYFNQNGIILGVVGVALVALVAGLYFYPGAKDDTWGTYLKTNVVKAYNWVLESGNWMYVLGAILTLLVVLYIARAYAIPSERFWAWSKRAVVSDKVQGVKDATLGVVSQDAAKKALVATASGDKPAVSAQVTTPSQPEVATPAKRGWWPWSKK